MTPTSSNEDAAAASPTGAPSKGRGTAPGAAQVDRRARQGGGGAGRGDWLLGPWPAIAVYLAYRFLLLATNFDQVAVPTYEVPGTGIQAVLLLEGWRGAPWSHFYDNAGGQLLAGLFTVPIFAVLGTSYAAMKVGSLILGVLLLLTVHRLLARTIGRTGAALACLGLAFAPPVLTGFTLMAMGNHFDGLLFISVALVLSLRALGHRREGRALVIAGAAFGLAIFLYLGSLLSLALLLPLLARGLLRLGGISRAAAGLARFALGVGLGLLPLALAGWMTEGRASDMASSLVMRPERDAAQLIEKARVLVTSLLPRSGCFEAIGPVPGHVIGWGYLALAATAWVAVARHLAQLRRRRDPHAQRVFALLGLQLLYPFAFLGVVWLTRRTRVVEGLQLSILESRYFVSFYFYTTLLIASAVGLAWTSAHASVRARARGQALVLALAGLASLCLMRTDPERLTDVLRSPAADFRYYSGVFGRDGSRDPVTGAITLDHEALARHCAAFEDEGERFSDVLFGLGWWLGSWDVVEQMRTGRPQPTEALLAPYPEAWHPWVARGLGGHLREGIRGPKTGPAVRARMIERLSGPAAQEVLQGLGMSRVYPTRDGRGRGWTRTRHVDGQVAALLPELDRAPLWSGVGADARRRLGRGLAGDRAWFEGAAAGLPAGLRGAFEAGLRDGVD